jgi:hypothetical protein
MGRLFLFAVQLVGMCITKQMEAAGGEGVNGNNESIEEEL